jgi:UDP-glucose 4-epimerase
MSVVGVVRPGSQAGDVEGVIEVDLSDVDRLAAALRGAGATVVCHLAWVGHPRSAGMDYESQLVANVVPSANVALAAGLAGLEHVVFLSSGGALATPRKGPRPAYGWAKLAVEALTTATSREFGFKLTILRPTALIGPGQDPARGLGVVTIFARQILLGEPIRIIGSPATSRDFLHVTDLCECIGVVIERRAEGVFEIGGPESVRLDTLVALLEEKLDRRAEIDVVGPTGVDPTTVKLDNAAIREAVGWAPRRTLAESLPEIITELVAHAQGDEGPSEHEATRRTRVTGGRRGPTA